MLRRTSLPFLLLLLVACGPSDDTPAPPVTAGVGGTGGEGGEGGGTVAPAALEAHAPDRTTVVVSFSGVFDGAALSDASGYGLTGEDGAPLAVEQVTVDLAASQVVVTTAPQKLGFQYTLTVDLPGVESPEEGLSFIAADTVTLWANDFNSPTFKSIEVVADRAGVGPHGVVYVQQGITPLVAGATFAQELNEPIYPTLTAFFGHPNDIDQNEKVVMLVFDQNAAFRGYVSPADALPDSTAMAIYGVHSNEMEIIYLNASRAQIDTAAHELTHLIYNPAHDPNALWEYHEEGLATCAQHVVYGQVQRAVDSFVDDSVGAITDGISLVSFTSGSYENYALAYLFWTYAASRLGGLDAYADLFAIEGDPATVSAFLEAELGESLHEVHRDMWVATHVQAPTGPQGFEGLIDFEGRPPPVAQSSDVALAAFGAVLIAPWANPIDYPGTQGPDIAYFGIDGAGAVDLDAPFETDGGMLLAMNLAESGASQPVNPAAPNLTTPERGTRQGEPVFATRAFFDALRRRHQAGERSPRR